ncbi:MAG: hypothetical protein U0795_14510 [Pirellulales bacterium]
MAFWIYKCNDNGKFNKGDWDYLFEQSSPTRWGNTEWTRPRGKLQVGDVVIAHQTDRKELVGLAEVTGFKRRGAGEDIMLLPIEEIRVKVPRIRECDRRINELEVWKAGPIKTIYDITTADACHLLRVARALAALEDACG